MCGFCSKVKDITYSGDNLIDGVTEGKHWKGKVTYSFPTSQDQYSYKYEANQAFEPITAQQAKSALFALEQSDSVLANDGFSVEGFTNINISQGKESASTIRLAQSDAPATAYAYSPGNYAQAGDVWFGKTYSYTDPEAGDYAWHTVLHEIGHALGLKHGHTRENGFGALPTEYDSIEYSIMTYRSHQGAGTGGYTYEQWSAPQTYMMADIGALQRLYGADFKTNAGDTVYEWKPESGDTVVNGEVGIDAGGNRIFATLWDGGGTDTYDLSAYTSDLKLSLQPGGFSNFGTGQVAYLGGGYHASGNIYNALLYKGDVRSLIENAIGGSGDDVIEGNDAANLLEGGAGDDDLSGIGGRDILVGGSGNDTLTGGELSDIFRFAAHSGADIIMDFISGLDKLHIDIEGFNAAEVLASAVEVGSDLRIFLDGESSVTLLNIARSDISLQDFLI